MSTAEIRRTRVRVDARARAMTPQIVALLQRHAQLVEARALAAARRKRAMAATKQLLRKADTPSKIEADLARLFEVYGLRQLRSSAERTAGKRVEVPRTYAARLAERSIFTARQVLARTTVEMTRSVNKVIADGLASDPPATEAEIAKRIREQFHGRGGGRVAEVKETDATVTTGRTKRLSVNNGTAWWVSSERARTIAQTEVGEAEEAGKVAGYEAVGASHMRWRSRQWPQGRHQSMDGQVVAIGEKFVYPDGSKGAYPRSPDSPVRHRVNCHCTTVPVFEDIIQ